MSSSNAQLSYTPYQSHRRAASSASVGGIQGSGQDTATSSNATVKNGPGPSSTFVQTSSGQAPPLVKAIRPIAQSVPSSTINANQSTTNPPPLRSISSLRAKAEQSSSNTVSNGKGKSNADQAEAAPAAGTSLQQSPARRIVSSSLTVPSTSTIPPKKPILETQSSNGPSRRNSPAPHPTSSQQNHARSVSHGSLPANLPHLMSTAQRLRTASPLDFSSPSSASPTHTPNAPLSPILVASGNGNSSQHIPTLYNDGVGRTTAYRAGFQPKGAYRVRTDEFIAARARRKQGGGRGETDSSTSAANQDQVGEGGSSSKSRSELKSQRLERRLEKLFALHYDDSPLFSEEEAFQLAPSWLPSTIRKARLQTEMEKRLREEEMRIVNWEDDKHRKACSICNTPFSLTIRKHHCRLCGRVVCASPHLSLPPGIKGNKDEKGNEEEVKCSSLIVADNQSGTKIKDVPRWDEPSSGGRRVDANGRTRGIRICRECKEIILHRQYMLDDGQLPAYVKLYDALISLQKEIEQSLPEFQEMVLGLQKHDAAIALGTQEEIRDPLVEPSAMESQSLASIKAKNRTALALQRDAAQARKQLLTNFANYDLLAKKIRNLDVQGNTSLKRLKIAIYTQANTFLQTNMFPLQNLPKLQNGGKVVGNRNGHKPGSSINGSIDSTANGGVGGSSGKSDDVRDQIVVLQQQLSLVKQYSASASKARKFQDASSLNASARELELEIERLQKLP